MNKDANVMERLNRSEVFGEYQKAFGEVTKPLRYFSDNRSCVPIQT
jgi:hypothetical protein